MGFGTYLLSETYFSRETFNSKREVEDRIQETEEYISKLKEKLTSFVIMTEPNKFCPKDCDPLYWLSSEISEILEELEDSWVDLYRYRILLDNWDISHNDKDEALGPPKEWMTKRVAFVYGDFIKNEGDDNEECNIIQRGQSKYSDV